MWIVSEALPSRMSWAICIAWLMGTAYPSVSVSPLRLGATDPAVMMPMTVPSASMSEPPESPGWMSASVSMRPLSRSDVPLDELVAVMDLSRPVTLPAASIGCPPSPPALPRPTTGSPTRTVDESPIGAGVSPDASRILITAMSWLES